MGDWVDFGEVKQAVSLEAVLHYYQVPVRRNGPHQLESRCPIHRGQRDDSFRASLGKNVFQCFACQTHARPCGVRGRGNGLGKKKGAIGRCPSH